MKKQNSKRTRDTFKNVIQFVKFGMVGLSNTVISYVLYSILLYFGLYYILANVIAFILSVLNSFFWNNKYIFKNETSQKRSIIKSLGKIYISYALTGLVMQSLLLYIFVDLVKLSKFIAPLLGLLITVPLNFFLNKYWVFLPGFKNTNKTTDFS